MHKDSNLYSTNSHFFFSQFTSFKKRGLHPAVPCQLKKKKGKKKKKEKKKRKRKQVEITEIDTIMMQKQIAATQSASYEIILNP